MAWAAVGAHSKHIPAKGKGSRSPADVSSHLNDVNGESRLIMEQGHIVTPPVKPDRPGRVTNQLKFIRNTVFNTLYKQKDVVWFKNPVNPGVLKIPNYHLFVKYPMDLGTIRERLKNNFYWSAAECLRDFQVMFANCYLYNNPMSEIVKSAQRLEKCLLAKLTEMPTEEHELQNGVARSSRKASTDDLEVIPESTVGRRSDRSRCQPKRYTEEFMNKTNKSSSSESESGGEEDNTDSDSSEDIVSEAEKFRQKQLQLLQEQLNGINEQMKLLKEQSLLEKNERKKLKKKSKSHKEKERKPDRKRKLAFSCKQKTGCSTNSEHHRHTEVPKKKLKTTPSAENVQTSADNSPRSSKANVDLSNRNAKSPMTDEEFFKLEEDISKLSASDVREVFSRIESCLKVTGTNSSSEENSNGLVDLRSLKSDRLWEIRTFVSSKLSKSMFRRSPSPDIVKHEVSDKDEDDEDDKLFTTY